MATLFSSSTAPVQPLLPTGVPGHCWVSPSLHGDFSGYFFLGTLILDLFGEVKPPLQGRPGHPKASGVRVGYAQGTWGTGTGLFSLEKTKFGVDLIAAFLKEACRKDGETLFTRMTGQQGMFSN